MLNRARSFWIVQNFLRRIYYTKKIKNRESVFTIGAKFYLPQIEQNWFKIKISRSSIKPPRHVRHTVERNRLQTQ